MSPELDAQAHSRRYESVDGLRALSLLWTVCFHSLFLLCFFVSNETFAALSNGFWTHWMSEGHFGVDVFFVLSGFLIGSMILSEYRRTGNILLRGFYIRRFFRIIPAYVLVLAVACGLGAENCSRAWANLLFVNNLLPHVKQCMPWTWSLAIEEQFYLIFPVFVMAMFLLTRHCFLALGFLLLLGFALNNWLVVHYGFDTPLQLNEKLFPESFARHIDLIYGKTYTRYGGILCGVILAYLLQYSTFFNWMRKHSCLATAAFIFCLAALGTLVFLPWASAQSTHHSPLWIPAFLANYRYLFAILVTYLLAFAITDWERPSRFKRFLSSRPWKRIAELSYGAYLLHPMVILSVYSMAPTPLEVNSIGMYGVIGINLVLTFALALPLYRFVEQPLREMGRRLAKDPVRTR